MSDQNDEQLNIMLSLVTKRWTRNNREITKFFTEREDSYYQNEIAPGKNRASWILGHLIAANDDLFKLLGFKEPLYPQLAVYYFSADRTYADAELPDMEELRKNWKTVTLHLTEAMRPMKPEDWLEKHTKVSEEGFNLDPTRNKLSVIMNSTLHTSHHLGQLAVMF